LSGNLRVIGRDLALVVIKITIQPGNMSVALILQALTLGDLVLIDRPPLR
jgi:hypothetical protein